MEIFDKMVLKSKKTEASFGLQFIIVFTMITNNQTYDTEITCQTIVS